MNVHGDPAMRRTPNRRRMLLLTLAAAAIAAAGARAGQSEVFRIKRAETYAFAERSKVTRRGDRIEIRFTAQAACDAVVTIEDPDGAIVRHLGYGVLGENAPEPFQARTLAQTVVWDGKDDAGKYVDNIQAMVVRVGLGLEPRFERDILWSPYRRIGSDTPLMQACAEGVLVFDGHGIDHLRLFDHDGNYKRTIHPFASSTAANVQGLRWHTFPQDGQKLPLTSGFVQATLLNAGTSGSQSDIFGRGLAATAMTVGPGGQIALAMKNLNRLHLDGSSGGLPFDGPEVKQDVLLGTIHEFKGGVYDVPPRAMAFSPDGKYLYIAGYYWSYAWHRDGLNGVARMEYGKNEPPALWKGAFVNERKQKLAGPEPDKLSRPCALAVDAKGRVYVADYFNDRIQVYAEDGTLVKSVEAFKPARIWVHPKTQEIWVGSWFINGAEWDAYLKRIGKPKVPVPPVLVQLGTLDKPTKQAQYDLPFLEYDHPREGVKFGGNNHMEKGRLTAVELDFWAGETTVWVIPASPSQDRIDYEKAGVKLYTLKGKKLALKRDTGAEAKKAVPLLNPPPFSRQRMAVNPANGRLYMVEQENGTDKNLCRVTEVEPESGKAKIVELPCHVEDLCFDTQGVAYLRVDQGILRTDGRTWREIPWDYGEEHEGTMFKGTSGGRSIQSVGVLRVPGRRSNPFWHLGGIAVNAKGELAVSTYNGAPSESRESIKNRLQVAEGKPYTPKLYPGRYRWGELHVFNRHGELVAEDAFPGVGHLDGLGLDAERNLYVMAGSTMLVNGKKYDTPSNDVTETLIKVRPGKAKIVSDSNRIPVPLSPDVAPKRPADVSGWLGAGGTAWVEGAEWLYGGVGFAGSNQPAPSCCCWNARFTLDLLGRSFAPEIRHYSVAVLDTAGNLVTRIGRYGNIDEGKPLVASEQNPNPRSIGGDEVSLFHAPFVASHTDRRLFIADPGNGRVLSVKLDYHVAEKVALKSVPDELAKE